MSRRISPFKLGVFIVVCAALGAVAFIWIGATRIFQSTKKYAAFFDEPITGLQAGAPVRYLGVGVGSVDSVALAPGDRLVEVDVKIRSSFHIDPSMALALTQPGITGSPFLSLEETPPDQRKHLRPSSAKLPVLPTRPGGGGIGGAIAGIEQKIASLHIEGLVDRWEGVAGKIESILARGDLEQVMENARIASSGLRRVAAAGAQGQPSEIESAVRDLQSATQSLKTATASMTRQIEEAGPGVDASLVLLRQDLAQLKQAVIEAQSLARSLRNEPGQLIERPPTNDPFRR
jgi:ABC-type transporter Mla subunit MlaD